MAVVSHFSKTAEYLLRFFRLPLVLILDLFPFSLSIILILFCALYTIFPGFWTYPEERKGAQYSDVYILTRHILYLVEY